MAAVSVRLYHLCFDISDIGTLDVAAAGSFRLAGGGGGSDAVSDIHLPLARWARSGAGVRRTAGTAGADAQPVGIAASGAVAPTRQATVITSRPKPRNSLFHRIRPVAASRQKSSPKVAARICSPSKTT